MEMKTPLIVLLFAILAAHVAAAAAPAGPLTVAVYDFTDADRHSIEYGGKITTLVTADLTTETNLVLLERSDLKKVLGEQSIGISGMVNSDTAAKIGQITGANVLVSGQVISVAKERLIIVANIIGTENGRLLAVQVEGAAANFVELTADLSRRVAQKIRDQGADLVTESKSHEEFLARLVKGVTGTNRPTVSLDLHFWQGSTRKSASATTEMGIILEKAGFVVVDDQAAQKPDMIITALVESSTGPQRGQLFSCRAIIEAKVQERRTGRIIAFDRQSADGVDIAKATADRVAIANAVDAVAERIVPLLAK